jgi:hypothetical protein
LDADRIDSSLPPPRIQLTVAFHAALVSRFLTNRNLSTCELAKPSSKRSPRRSSRQPVFVPFPLLSQRESSVLAISFCTLMLLLRRASNLRGIYRFK